jgi:hypothetical protein
MDLILTPYNFKKINLGSDPGEGTETKKIFKVHFDEKNQPPNEAGNESPIQGGKNEDTQTQGSGSYVMLAQQESETRGDNVEIDQEKQSDTKTKRLQPTRQQRSNPIKL